MAKIYERTESGVTTHVSIREGLDEINTAMMGPRRNIKEMSAAQGDAWITYADGRKVTLVQVEAPETEGYTQGQPVVVQRPGQTPRTGTVAHIHTAPGYVAVLDDRNRSVSSYPVRFVSAVVTEEEPEDWASTATGTVEHRFSSDGRALCNRRYRAYDRPVSLTDSRVRRTRSEIENGEYSHLYTFCPTCSAL